jgi:hypothetical protein
MSGLIEKIKTYSLKIGIKKTMKYLAILWIAKYGGDYASELGDINADTITQVFFVFLVWLFNLIKIAKPKELFQNGREKN